MTLSISWQHTHPNPRILDSHSLPNNDWKDNSRKLQQRRCSQQGLLFFSLNAFSCLLIFSILCNACTCLAAGDHHVSVSSHDVTARSSGSRSSNSAGRYKRTIFPSHYHLLRSYMRHRASSKPKRNGFESFFTDSPSLKSLSVEHQYNPSHGSDPDVSAPYEMVPPELATAYQTPRLSQRLGKDVRPQPDSINPNAFELLPMETGFGQTLPKGHLDRFVIYDSTPNDDRVLFEARHRPRKFTKSRSRPRGSMKKHLKKMMQKQAILNALRRKDAERKALESLGPVSSSVLSLPPKKVIPILAKAIEELDEMRPDKPFVRKQKSQKAREAEVLLEDTVDDLRNLLNLEPTRHSHQQPVREDTFVENFGKVKNLPDTFMPLWGSESSNQRGLGAADSTANFSGTEWLIASPESSAPLLPVSSGEKSLSSILTPRDSFSTQINAFDKEPSTLIEHFGDADQFKEIPSFHSSQSMDILSSPPLSSSFSSHSLPSNGVGFDDGFVTISGKANGLNNGDSNGFFDFGTDEMSFPGKDTDSVAAVMESGQAMGFGGFWGDGGFSTDDKDCADIDIKPCTTDLDCSCNGFYTCSANGRCQSKSTSGQSSSGNQFWHEGPIDFGLSKRHADHTST